MYWTFPDVLNPHYTGCNCLIVCHFWAKSGKYYFDKHQWKINAVMKRKSSNCVGILSDQGKLQLHQTSEYTVMGHIKILGKLIIIFMIMFWWHHQYLRGSESLEVVTSWILGLILRKYQFDQLSSPRHLGLLHRNVCPAPGLLDNRRPGLLYKLNDAPWAGLLHQLAFKLENC